MYTRCSAAAVHTTILLVFSEIFTLFKAMNEHLYGVRYYLIAWQLPNVSTIPEALERMFCCVHSFYANFFPYEST